MRVCILGNSGMLGHIVYGRFSSSYNLSVHGFGRETLDLFPMSDAQVYRRLTRHVGLNKDYVINCIGAIKPHFNNPSSYSTNVYVNAVFPLQLANWGQKTNTRIIHITTDCVFGVNYGLYTEVSLHDPLDAYGKSKSLGEPSNAMVIRTSIIGPEKESKKSLFEWIRSNQGKTVDGFTNHWWNGMTTVELARCLYKIIDEEWYNEGTYHIFSDDISKYELVKSIISAYEWDISVNPRKVEPANRTLRTTKELCTILNIPDIRQQLKDMARICPLD